MTSPFTSGLITSTSFLLLATALAAQDLSVKWDDAIKIQTEDKVVDFKIGGRMHNDWAFISGTDGLEAALGGPIADGNEFRRTRVYISGTIDGFLIVKFQYDFEDGEADFKDVYGGIKGIPGIGTFKAGQFKEPMGLEELNTSNNITLMERSNANSFSAERNSGFMVNNHVEERFNWALGVFRDTDAFGDSSGDGEYNITGRVTGTPIKTEDSVVHVGVSLSLRSPNDGEVQIKQSREVHLAPVLADTGTIAGVDSRLDLGVEAAFVQGSFSLQGEYRQSEIDLMAGGMSPTFHGHYVQAAYTLTGESRSYQGKDGIFGGIKPANDFRSDDGGIGAVELAVRYSGLDLSDAGILGGEVDGLTVGLNWYLNPNARTMLNYVNQDLDGTGDFDALQLRFQVAF